VRVLAEIRVRGAIGEASLLDAVAHAERFVELIPSDATVVDLGSGGGLPGLVIAVRRPDVRLTLVERRLNRADQLRRAVAALGLGGWTTVVCDDVRAVGHRRAPFDVVTARSFAAPAVLVRLAAPLCQPGGLALVSEPPAADAARWPTVMLDRRGWIDLGVTGGIRRLRRQ
jgi:16S rRNA (guanine527-N7)-methyltransferase